MDLAAYLGAVTAMVVLAVGAMGIVVGLLGRRIDDLCDHLGHRIDAVNDSLSTRMDRLESQNDAILGAVSDLGQRVARLESHG
jgi:transcription antitermination factor NusA-like protein